MTLQNLNINFTAILPEIYLTVLAMAVLFMDLLTSGKKSRIIGYVTCAGLLPLFPLAMVSVDEAPAFGGMVISDGFALFFTMLFILAALMTVMISITYLARLEVERGEYYYLILFATLGMVVMAKAADLLSFYVGLELMALSFYILVAFRAKANRSKEGALKYFILGALSSGILLYGISFAFGATGTTSLAGIAERAGMSHGGNPYLLLAVVLILAGFSFKVALFPFHLWAPDAYEGAPVPVTAFLSVGSKAAAFAVFLRIFLVAFPALHPDWSKLMWLLSAATMIFGSVVAIPQKNVVRMLAYSSIAHAGIILMGLLVHNETGVSAVLYYLLAYTFMNTGAFAVVAALSKLDGRGENIADLAGLSARHPLLAFLMALFLLSLAGVPPTAGFAAKFLILASAMEARYYGLATIGIIATAIALFFYAKVVFHIYMREPDTPEAPVSLQPVFGAALLIAAAGTVIPGIYPAPFIAFAVNAVKPFLN